MKESYVVSEPSWMREPTRVSEPHLQRVSKDVSPELGIGRSFQSSNISRVAPNGRDSGQLQTGDGPAEPSIGRGPYMLSGAA